MKRYIRSSEDTINRDYIISECMDTFDRYMALPQVAEYFQLYGMDVELARDRLQAYLNKCSDSKLATIERYSTYVTWKPEVLGESIGYGYFECPNNRPGSLRFSASNMGVGSQYLWDYRFDNPDVDRAAKNKASNVASIRYSSITKYNYI
ncbi:MAG: hypothetical protein IJE78_04985 [Bacteroidaceae bacterium]|nr:hypothetical protein [Bacteroidaceae bacterium]